MAANALSLLGRSNPRSETPQEECLEGRRKLSADVSRKRLRNGYWNRNGTSGKKGYEGTLGAKALKLSEANEESKGLPYIAALINRVPLEPIAKLSREIIVRSIPKVRRVRRFSNSKANKNLNATSKAKH